MAENETKDLAGEVKSLNVELAAIKKALRDHGERPVYPAGLKPGDMVPATPANKAEEGKWGFKSYGDFVLNVRESLKRGSQGVTKPMQKMLEIATKAAGGMGEAVGSDGGFLVPPTFSQTIFQRVYENDILKRTDQYTVSGNSMVFPRNAETSRVDGARWGGVRGYWLDEGSSITQSAPSFGRFQLTLRKLACIARVTEELIADSMISLEQYLTRGFADEIAFLVGAAVIRGTGVGQPMGVLNAPCLISVVKESGQAAATIVTENIVKMWARLWGRSQSNAVWFVNQDVYPQLYTMTLGVGTAGVVTYMPPGGVSAAPYGTILGRPCVPIEFCSTLGTVGDIILADMSQYVTISKGSADSQMSMHLYFNTDELAYRVTFRLDGQPWWPAALTPFQGSATQSPLIALATRA